MSGVVTLTTAEAIGALVAGGFRVSRRERGLVLLVRGCDAVVLPEEGTLTREKLLSLFDRAGTNEATFLEWLARRERRRGSGFRARAADAPARRDLTLEEVLAHSRAVRARAEAAHAEAREVLKASTAAAQQHVPRPVPDSERLRAAQRQIELWDEAVRELHAKETQRKGRL